MGQTVQIEQCASGRWHVVRVTPAGERVVIKTCAALAEARAKARQLP
jgi:hypothetical protein